MTQYSYFIVTSFSCVIEKKYIFMCTKLIQLSGNGGCENVTIWMHLTEPDLLQLRLYFIGIWAKQHRWFASVKTAVMIWIPVIFGLRKFFLPNMIWHHLHIIALYCNMKHLLDCERSKGYKGKDYKEGETRKVHVEVLIVVITGSNVMQYSVS